MDCKVTSTEPTRTRRQSGVGIIEFMVAMAVGSLVILAVMMAFSFSSRSFVALTNYSSLDKQSRHALDTMTQEIRMTRCLANYATNYAFFTNYDNNLLIYWWDQGGKKVYRWRPSSGEPIGVMLDRCDLMRFDFFQRNPIGGVFDYYPPSTNLYSTTCKMVQLTWICSTNVLNLQKNSESVQSAKVVIRNQ
ncbi:MAG TPA: prepilin-type N-terminal cleavage/methylation domain-containing protein [Verrucomicrobiae bacterium]|jgi:hypothetical protein